MLLEANLKLLEVSFLGTLFSLSESLLRFDGSGKARR